MNTPLPSNGNNNNNGIAKNGAPNGVNGNGFYHGDLQDVALLDYTNEDDAIFGTSGASIVVAEPETESYDPEFEALIEGMLHRVGEDPAREGLERTPLRVAKAMDFLTSGYTTSVESVLNDALFEDDGEEMVIVKDIEFYSLCEHHMLPFYGKIHIGYLPDGKIVGLSKLARIADVFARRLQVQERLTNQVADALVEILEPRGVAVVAEASHFCMMMRGVQKQESSTVTRAMRGDFKTDSGLRQEFMQLLQG